MYGSGKNITKRPVSDLNIRSQHPHGICLLAKHVNTVHRVDHFWYILVLGLEQSVRQWENITKRSVFHQICDSRIMACCDYSTSAVVRVWACSPAWRYYYNVRFNLWRYHYNVGFNSTDFRWVCYSEGPGEQPSTTTLNEIINENTWTGVVS